MGIIRIIIILIAFALVGCSLQSKSSSNTFEKSYEKIVKEIKNIKEHPISQFNSTSDNFNIRTEFKKGVYDEKDIVSVSIILDRPTTYLKNVNLTFLLNDELVKYFHTDELFGSNIPSETTLEPGGEYKGIYVTKSFIVLPEDHPYKDSLFNRNEFYSNLIDIKIKASWKDENGKLNEEYIKISEDNISFDEKIYTLYE